MSEENPNKIKIATEAHILDESEIAEAQEGIEAAAPAPVDDAESRQEAINEIGDEEEKLGTNIQEHASRLRAVEGHESPSQSRALLISAEIKEAYENAKKRINEISIFLTGLATAGIAGGLLTENNADVLKNAVGMLDTEQWNQIGQRVAEGGVGLGLAATAVFAIGHSLNQLKRKESQIKAGI